MKKIIFIITLLLVGCSEQTPKNIGPEEITFADSNRIPQEKSSLYTGIYENTTWGFTIELPEGFFATEQSTDSIIVHKSSEDGPSPDFTIQMSSGTLKAYKEKEDIRKEENFRFGNLAGKVLYTPYSIYGPDYLCPHYILEQEERLYVFSGWECVKSEILDLVLQSFRLK